MTQSFDVIILGAGPAGTIAASHLQRAGLRVCILEKEKFPRFVIGESLLPQCMDLLHRADLLSVIEKAGFQRKTGAEFFDGTKNAIFDFGRQFTQSFQYTYQVQRGRFDHLLAETVAARGVKVFFETQCLEIEFAAEGVHVLARERTEKDFKISARFLLDATGHGRYLAKRLGLDRPADFPPRASLFAHLTDATCETSGIDFEKIWICVHPTHPETWYWVIPFADRTASVGVVGSVDFFKKFSGDADADLRMLMAAQPSVHRRFPVPSFKFPTRKITAYASASQKLYGPSFVILGHAGEFLDPVFSSGVTLSMKAGELAALHLIDILQKSTPADWEKNYVKPLRTGLETFKAFVQGWYDLRFQTIIFHPRRHADLQKMVCSILAGYVWDQDNPFVRKPKEMFESLFHLCVQNP